MAKGFNKVTLMGNLTRDIDLRTTPNGQSVGNFSLAVSRSWKNQNGEQQEATSFINCVAWGKPGEIIAQYLKKGDPLLISGRLDQRSYEDKDGNKRQAVEVNVEDFNFIGGGNRDGGGGGGNSGGSSAPRPQSNKKSDDVVIEDIDDKPIDLSEIPF